MKKIVSIVVLMIAFGFSANAQSNLKLESDAKSKDQNVKEMAYSELRELSSVVELTPELKNDFLTLLVMRNEAVNNAKTYEEKAAIYERFGQKLLSGLSEQQSKKLSENKELYNKLTNLKYSMK
ncbi:hypothetical protein [Flavobacterium sp.]|jgi:hypothetical protein|uniref:hypothetical protein n=1 Tax=Flavobacterium sp. TaxID=239 RepID=UPI0037C0D5BC